MSVHNPGHGIEYEEVQMKRRGKFQKQKEDKDAEESQKQNPVPPTKEEMDEEHFQKHMETVNKIHALRDSGLSEDAVALKMRSWWAESYVRKVYRMTHEEAVQEARDMYENQSLGIPKPVVEDEDKQ